MRLIFLYYIVYPLMKYFTSAHVYFMIFRAHWNWYDLAFESCTGQDVGAILLINNDGT